jgi:hypothetical protein
MAPRTTKEILAAAEQLAARFESGELPGSSATHVDGEIFRSIFEAFERRAHADADLAEAIVSARQKGASWDSIGSMIGTTGEAARSRYGLATAGS